MYAEYTLEELLEELKVFGDIYIHFNDHTEYKWYCKYIVKIKGKEYSFENSGKDLFEIVRKSSLCIEEFRLKR